MEIRYYVCALGYDSDYCVTDYEREFGDFDTVEEARECYNKIVESVENDPRSLLPSYQHKVAYWKIQLEECEEYGEEINCVDILACIDILAYTDVLVETSIEIKEE